MTMQIKRDEVIAGLPALEARKLMRELSRRMNYFSYRQIGQHLSIKPSLAKHVIEDFVKAGFIEPSKNPGYFDLTQEGCSLASASAKGAFKRKACDEAYAKFLARVAEVNNDPELTHYISKLILFGSYFHTVKETYGDIDICIELKFRYAHPFQRYLNKYRIAKSGRTSLNFSGTLSYGRDEVNKILKNKSNLLSISEFHNMEEFLKDKPQKELETPPPILMSEMKIIEITKIYKGAENCL